MSRIDRRTLAAALFAAPVAAASGPAPTRTLTWTFGYMTTTDGRQCGPYLCWHLGDDPLMSLARHDEVPDEIQAVVPDIGTIEPGSRGSVEVRF